jgi:RHS repeat-associated protein
MTTKTGVFFGFLFPLLLLLAPEPAQAKYIGEDPPICEPCNNSKSAAFGGDSSISYSEGNLKEGYTGPRVLSSTGATLDFSMSYNSYNADGSRVAIDTVMGYGWTHNYNSFLFSQRGNMYRFDGNGRVTTYKLGAGGTFTAAPGYFETLVKNPDGSFTLTQKDKTVFQFASIPNTPFLVGGPVFRLTRITDRNNNVTTLTYTAGKLTEITDTYGRKLTLAYNAQNKLTSITDPLFPSRPPTLLQYDSTGRKLLRITDPEGKFVQYSYNTLYQITRKIDKDGRIFDYLYQNLKPVAIRDGAGKNLFRLSNPGNWATDSTALAMNQARVYIPATTSKTDGRGNVWKYEYDSRGYTTKMTAPDNAITRYSYDIGTPTNTLMPASITDANNHTTSYQYDALGNLIRQTDALGHVTQYTYEPVFNQMTGMTDANGRVTSYVIDPVNGNRLKETDPLGGMRQWTYDSNGNVLTETDKNGNLSKYEYDASGNRLKTTDAVGQPVERQTAYTYDAVGNTLTRTDDNAHTTSYQYDGLNRLIKETDPAGQMTRTVYDGQGNRIQVIDRNGNATFFEYDLRQRLVKTTVALPPPQNFTTEAYDGNDNRTAMTDRNGHTTSFQYDVQNRLIKTTDAITNMTTRSYDGVGNVLTECDANNHCTAYTYDALDRRITSLDAEGNLTRTGYEGDVVCLAIGCPTLGSSLMSKQTDANGKVTYFKYDGLDRLVKQIRKQTDIADTKDADDAQTRYEYDAHGNRTLLEEPNLNQTKYEYDGLNRLIKETNAANDISLTEYDGVDNVIKVTAPNGNVTDNFYDVLDRLTSMEDSVGLVATYTYDPVGNRLTDCDGNNHCTANQYDNIYRIIKVTDALSAMTVYTYDPVGNLTQLTDRENHGTCYRYDDINRRIRMTQEFGTPDCTAIDADDIWTQYDYDGVGNLLALTTAKNGSSPAQCSGGSPPADCETTRYAYDDINRLLEETYPDPAPNMRTFAYDGVGNITKRTDQKGQVTDYQYSDLYFLEDRLYSGPGPGLDDFMSYDLSGRMLSACREGLTDDLPADTCPGWLVEFMYDGANRVTETHQNGRTIGYVYNIPGRTRQVKYPGGREITESTDPRSRLDKIDDAGSPPPIVQYSYDPGNRVLNRAYRNGTTAGYGYNDNNWITTLEHKNGATLIAGFGYEYDNEGNKDFEEKTHETGRSEVYSYDDAYRLIDFKVGALVGSVIPVPLTQTGYNLDKLGNWDEKTTDGATETREHNQANEITKIDLLDIASDDNGNLLQDERYDYDYDEENRLIKAARIGVTPQVVGEYRYDALSRRVVKLASPVAATTDTRYFYDSARIIEEQDAAMATLATYVYGNYIDEVLTMDRGGQAYYYHQNALWSVAAITDNAGSVAERYSYDAYGAATITNGAGVPVAPNAWGTPHSAIGNPWMFTGRQLDEETGIYFYRARVYDSGKGRFLQRDPRQYIDGMNLYQYVGGRPTFGLDPDGLILRVPTWKDYKLFEGLLAELCPEGEKWDLSYWKGVVSSSKAGFCNERTCPKETIRSVNLADITTVTIPAHTIAPGYQRAGHRVSCECICNAINANFTITLYSRAGPGGDAMTTGDPRPVNIGPARPRGYEGRNDPNPPDGNANRVRASQFIIFGHEMCGHAVPGLPHPPEGDPRRYTDRDPVIQIENRIRGEHNYGTRTG